MAEFQWTPKRDKAAFVLAGGYTQAETGKIVGVSERTIRRWLDCPEFMAEVDTLTHMVNVSKRAERLRLAMRAVRQLTRNGRIDTNKDVLDWLKFAQSETDGVKLDLGAAFAKAFDGADVAGSGSGRAEQDDDDERSPEIEAVGVLREE